MPVERPGLECPAVHLGENVRGVQLVDAAEVVSEAGGLADGQVRGLALQGATGGVVDEDVDGSSGDQADQREGRAEPEPHRNPAASLPTP